MSSPRHLWSGDWELESAAAREELARRAQIEEPAQTAPDLPPAPSRRSAYARAAAWLRELPRRIARWLARLGHALARTGRGRRRVALLVVLLTLLTAGAAYGVTSLLAGGQGTTMGNAHHWLGIDVAGSPFGIVITDVVPGSPAAKAGLEPLDLINEIDNQPVTSVDGVSTALDGLHPGSRVEIQFSRGPISYTTSATLAASSP